MKTGIYTPTHKPEWLEGAWVTTRDQDFDTWVILLNGGAKAEDLPRGMAEDPRVIVLESQLTGGSVGAYKKEACAILAEQKCDLFVELDHDDELTPTAIQEIQVCRPDEFLFSNCASSTKYSAAWGWNCSTQIVNNRRLWVHDTPAVSARSLCEIFYAPNHVRVWGSELYEKLGGYTALPVADDHDLLCRTYISRAKMTHIPRPLYVQNVHNEQTQVARNQEIQQAQATVGSQHIYELVWEQARRSEKLRIDLGGRPADAPGWESLNMTPPATFISDLTNGLPFEDNSVGAFRAHDILEHVSPDKVIPLMNEIYRCLTPGGWLLAAVPATEGKGAFQDPTHVSFWNSNSWKYYTDQRQAQYVPEFVGRFQLTWHRETQPVNGVSYTQAALWALKGQRVMGQVEI